MLKRDYEKERNKLTDDINTLLLERIILDQRFKESCNHPVDSLTVETNHYEDEYGKDMESWTDYTYRCSRCNTTIPDVKKMFTDMKILRDTITAHISKK